MKRFPGIDGLRGWLAWTIVISHIFLFTAENQRLPVLGKIDNAAHQAVLVFMIISGFVITHLLLEKKENYTTYITRRFLRIYPVYIICFLVGIFTTYLHLKAFADHPYGSYIPEPELLTNETISLQTQGVFWHFLAHLSLLFGAIPNRVLGQSQYMFLGTAWSLSLEWQFYLIAPLTLFLCRNSWGKIFVSSIAVAGCYAYNRGWLGDFEALSFLPGATPYFAAGILTRFIIPKLSNTKVYPALIIFLFFCLAYMLRWLIPFVVWIAFVAWMILGTPQNILSIWVKRLLLALFESSPIKYLGKLSYSTFLAHEPVIHLIGYICIKLFVFSMLTTVVVTAVFAPLAIIFCSAILHKYVEIPAIAFGKRLFKEPLELQSG